MGVSKVCHPTNLCSLGLVYSKIGKPVLFLIHKYYYALAMNCAMKYTGKKQWHVPFMTDIPISSSCHHLKPRV